MYPYNSIPEDFPQISGANNNRVNQAYQKKHSVNRIRIRLDTEYLGISAESLAERLLRTIASQHPSLKCEVQSDEVRLLGRDLQVRKLLSCRCCLCGREFMVLPEMLGYC
jgi:hypothetical protein